MHMLHVHVLHQGWKLQNILAFPSEKYEKKFTCPALFSPFLDMQTDSDFQNFSLSFRKMSKLFTYPALFLPVLDRQTACNFQIEFNWPFSGMIHTSAKGTMINWWPRRHVSKFLCAKIVIDACAVLLIIPSTRYDLRLFYFIITCQGQI